MFLASGYTSAETAQLLALSEVEAKVTRRSIMRKLQVKNEQQFLRYIRVNLSFLQN
jgi:fimbrial protein FimW